MHRLIRLALISLAFMVSFSQLSAQNTVGSISGNVQGATANTTVIVIDTSRNIERAAVLSDSGTFDVNNLSPGAYQVEVRVGGNVIDTVTVLVRIDSTTSVNMATTQNFIEEILVTGNRIASIDTGIAESGLVVTSEELELLPVGRSLNSVALLTAGASGGDTAFGGVAFSGSSVAENQVYINGLNVTNFRTGVGFGYVPFEFLSQVQTRSGGYGPQYGRSTGGIINAVTKSGSNDFKFGMNSNTSSNMSHTPNTFSSLNQLYESETTTNDIWVSGALIKDKLFYYAFTQDYDSNYQSFSAQSNNSYESIDVATFNGYKLDAYITDNQRLEYTYWDNTSDELYTNYAYDRDTNVIGSSKGETIYQSGGENSIFAYTGKFGPMTVSYATGTNNEGRSVLPSTFANSPIYAFLDGGFEKVTNFASTRIEKGSDVRDSSRFDISFDLGNHLLKIGTETENLTAENATRYSGTGNYWYLDVDQTAGNTEGWMQTCDDLYPASATTTFTCSDDPMYTSIAGVWRYISGGTFTTENSAFYISDTFDIGDRLTIEAGLRSSSFKNNNADGETFIGVDNQVAPRFAAVYNSGNANQSKWFGSYGEYYLPIATNTNIRMSGAEFYTESYYQWDGNLDNVTDAGPTNKNFLYTDEYSDGTVPDVAAVLDQNIKPMYQSEFILGNEQVLANGLVLGVKAIYRDLATTIEDILIDEGMWNHFAGTENEDDILAYYGGSSHYVLTNPGTDIKVYDEVTGEVVTITAAEAAIPAPSRAYKALELSLTKAWDGRSGWNANYTLGSSYGNLEGWVRSDNDQDDAGITSLFDSGDMTVNGTGYLPNDRRHTLKLYGTKAVGDRLTVGTNIIWQTGRPKNCFGNGPAGSIQYTNSMFYCDGAIAERGSRGRQPSVMNMDINAQYTINLGNHDVVLTANIFNIFDTHTVKETVEQNTGYYGYTTSMQPARAARLGFRYTFN